MSRKQKRKAMRKLLKEMGLTDWAVQDAMAKELKKVIKEARQKAEEGER